MDRGRPIRWHGRRSRARPDSVRPPTVDGPPPRRLSRARQRYLASVRRLVDLSAVLSPRFISGRAHPGDPPALITGGKWVLRAFASRGSRFYYVLIWPDAHAAARCRTRLSAVAFHWYRRAVEQIAPRGWICAIALTDGASEDRGFSARCPRTAKPAVDPRGPISYHAGSKQNYFRHGRVQGGGLGGHGTLPDSR